MIAEIEVSRTMIVESFPTHVDDVIIVYSRWSDESDYKWAMLRTGPHSWNRISDAMKMVGIDVDAIRKDDD